MKFNSNDDDDDDDYAILVFKEPPRQNHWRLIQLRLAVSSTTNTKPPLSGDGLYRIGSIDLHLRPHSWRRLNRQEVGGPIKQTQTSRRSRNDYFQLYLSF